MFASCQSGREGAANGTHAAIERKFAEKNVGVENLAEEGTLASEQTERHRQIEGGAFFANVRGREIDGDALRGGKIEAAVPERRADALAAFFYGNVGESNDSEKPLESRTHIYLDFDEIGVNFEDSGTQRFE